MIQQKTIGYWLYWFFLYGIAALPVALFGGIMASSFIYNYDHWHRPRWNQQEYADTLSYGELAAAVICAVPGLAWVLWSQLKDWRKEREKAQTLQAASMSDTTVWPPPPAE